MNLHLLDIPADTSTLAGWMEEQLVSDQCGQWLAQLQIVSELSETRQTTKSLDEILGPDVSRVVQQGLSASPPEQLRELLAHPAALMVLQHRIYEGGGDVWFRHQADAARSPVRQANLNELKSRLVDQQTLSPARSIDDSANSRLSSSGSHRRAVVWQWLSSAAAILMIVAVTWSLMSAGNAGTLAKWGWSTAEGLPNTESPQEYLMELAAGGQAWFDKRVDSPASYRQRLRELSAGCQTLIAAEHRVLAVADRQWLLEKCEAWQSQFQDQLLQVEADPLQYEKFLQQTNDTVHTLVAALQERARNI